MQTALVRALIQASAAGSWWDVKNLLVEHYSSSKFKGRRQIFALFVDAVGERGWADSVFSWNEFPEAFEKLINHATTDQLDKVVLVAGQKGVSAELVEKLLARVEQNPRPIDVEKFLQYFPVAFWKKNPDLFKRVTVLAKGIEYPELRRERQADLRKIKKEMGGKIPKACLKATASRKS